MKQLTLAQQYVPVQHMPQEESSLAGRDVLNRFRITLDGPNMVLEIE